MTINDIYKGTSRYIRINVQLNSVAQNITGSTINFLVKEDKTDANIDAVIDTDADCLTSGSVGTAILYLSTTDTDIDTGNYFYELLWTKDTGEKYMLLESNINITYRVRII